jgi:hypothetical protein
MIILEIWPKGYADFGGTVTVRLPDGCNDADIQEAVCRVNPWATLSSVRRPQVVAPITEAELKYWSGDNS